MSRRTRTTTVDYAEYGSFSESGDDFMGPSIDVEEGDSDEEYFAPVKPTRTTRTPNAVIDLLGSDSESDGATGKVTRMSKVGAS
jgi:hypothetical protein